MSEQTIQNALYANPVKFGNLTCRSLGATTIKDLVLNKEISGLTLKECDRIKTKKPDVIILNSNNEIVIFIEMKDPSKFKSDTLIQKAIGQELDVAKRVRAKIYIVSDGETFIWINPLTEELIIDEAGEPIRRKIKPKDLTREEQQSLAEYIDDVCFCMSDSNNQLLPKEYLDPTPLARKTALILQNMSLSSAKNSLYTFVEFFTFKFLSDIGVLKGIYSFNHICFINTTQSSRDAFKQYLTTVRTKLLELFPVNSKDNTTIINGRLFHTQIDEMGNPIIIDSAADCFGKLLECFQEYEKEHGKFVYIHKDFKSKLFEMFMKNSSDKDGMGQFFTPLKVVQEMVRMVEVKEGMTICDPACGVGKFLLEAASKVPNSVYFANGKLKYSVNIEGFEKRMEDNNDDLTAILAKANMLIYYSDLFKNNCDSENKIKLLANELLNKVITSYHTTLGTLGMLYVNKYDLILANPPYYQSAAISNASKSVTLNGSNDETKAYTANGRGIEGLFTEWIIKSLKPGGVANVILPDGLFTNIGNKNLKQLILDSCYIDSIISLPVGTFFNASKKTFILTLRKRFEQEKGHRQNHFVFTYLCSSIGETLDTYRFPITLNDLHAAVDLYNLYKSNRDNVFAIQAVESDDRAKLLSIDLFQSDKSWFIDDFWSDAEKIELGIKKADNVMSLDEFEDFMMSLVSDIKDYKEAVECLKRAL